MSPFERRFRLLELLNARRHDTYDNLASEFNVSKRTIRYDIEALMCRYPIETVCGRYGGGVWLTDGYYLHQKPDSNELNAEQTELLRGLRVYVNGHKLEVLNGILVQFAPRHTVP